MSALRDEIRAILREEMAALCCEGAAGTTETVQISSSADLCRFARDILARASSQEFVSAVTTGQLTFALLETPVTTSLQTPQPPKLPRPIVASPAPEGGQMLDKPLITESDIANLGRMTRTLLVGFSSRITPLANDEARRKGIRIERIKA